MFRFLILMVMLVVPCSVMAQVERSVLTSGIEQREPMDDLGKTVTLPDGDYSSVYFFTHIRNLANAQIVHRWIYNGREMAAVTLNIGSDNWRTYSSKRIRSHWRGEWQVQVWHQDLMLMVYDFQVN